MVGRPGWDVKNVDYRLEQYNTFNLRSDRCIAGPLDRSCYLRTRRHWIAIYLVPRRGVFTLRWCVGRREVGSPETQFLTQRSNGQELILTGHERTGELGQRARL